MASSSASKLRALMKKNLLILKRNICSTIFEIIFPIILLLLCYALKQAFKLKITTLSEDEYDTYYQDNSALYLSDGNKINYKTESQNSDYNLKILPVLKICSEENAKREKRSIIAAINVPDEITNRIIEDIGGDLTLTIEKNKFKTVDDLNSYIKDKKYGQDDEHPLICFGISYKQEGHNYDYSMHYFDSSNQEGVQDIPDSTRGLFNRFRTGPDLDSYELYQTSGYVYIMKIINEHILKQETGKEVKINLGMIAMPYIDYRSDPFSGFMGYIIPFFIVIAYMCPLCLYVYKMVGEKENKSKEGMKIMGLGEGTYFLSYFIQYFIIAFIDSIINTIFMSLLFKKIPFIFLFLLLFLWTMDVFALIFFFQSFIDKTRVALILSLLIYFVMFFLSMACMDESAKKAVKIVLSIFPPVCIMLGIILLGKFESNFKQFHYGDYTKTYTNYSLGVMNLMQLIDFLLFLFLGYYLQNVLPHEFGIKRPVYFLCTKTYWCGSDKNNKNKNNNNVNQEIDEIDQKIDKENKDSERKLNKSEKEKNKNFEGEDLYKDKDKPDDVLKIENIVKIFGDGKKAVDKVCLNFYKDEIFALLGHNGAWKNYFDFNVNGAL